MSGRNKDNKPDSANHITSNPNNVKDENFSNNVKDHKRKLLESESEVAARIEDANVSVIVHSGGEMEPLPPEQEEEDHADPPQHKKKVKTKIKMKQRSKLDVNAFTSYSDPSSPQVHVYSSSPQKVIIDTSKNTTIPNTPNNSDLPNTSTNQINTENTDKDIPSTTTTITEKTTNAANIPNTTNIPSTTNTNTNTNATIRTLSKSDALPSTKTKEGGTTQQQDKMQKLAFLTDLYDQGYITVRIYRAPLPLSIVDTFLFIFYF
jgi:hypothetical protein